MNIFSGLRDFIEEKIDDLKEWYSSLTESEGEEEFFDEEEQAEEIAEEIESLETELETLPEEEPAEDFDIYDITAIDAAEAEAYKELNFPDWINRDDQDRISDSLGIDDYNDLTDAEKDEFLEGWRGFEEADEPAEEPENEDFERFKDELQRDLGIPSEIIDNLSEEELLRLSMISGDEEIGLGREWSELEPEDLADELGRDYRGSFSNWEDFINSNLWDFIIERPDLFDIYIDEDGNIEIYEDTIS